MWPTVVAVAKVRDLKLIATSSLGSVVITLLVLGILASNCVPFQMWIK